jgi:hypothetical protein
MIEYGEGVAVLQGQSSPCLQRRTGGYIELRDGRFVRGQCIIHVSAPVSRYGLQKLQDPASITQVSQSLLATIRSDVAFNSCEQAHWN